MRRRSVECPADRPVGIPPLIVTLGSLSLFRGIAEGITHAAENIPGSPPPFSRWGRDTSGGIVPGSSRSSLGLRGVHRDAAPFDVGRALYAIGFTGTGARYAGIPVARRIARCTSFRAMSSLAAIIYVARLGQARSDAGTGYELDAITAVVLGGTSVFGGRGSLWGTLLGLSAHGHAERPAARGLADGAGRLMTGTLLLVTIALDRCQDGAARGRRRGSEEIDVRNRQVAAICAAVLAARSSLPARTPGWSDRSATSAPAQSRTPRQRRLQRQAPVIAMMPKAKGRSVLRQLPRRRGGGGEGTRRRADLGWPDQSRCRQAERVDRELDHAQGGRHRRRGRESGRHLQRAAQGARARHQGAHLGCGR